MIDPLHPQRNQQHNVNTVRKKDTQCLPPVADNVGLVVNKFMDDLLGRMQPKGILPAVPIATEAFVIKEER